MASVTFQVTLTAEEARAMEYAVLSIQDWINNAAHNYARIAAEEIVQLEIASCLAAGIQIPSTKEAIVAQAFERGTVKTGAQRNAEAEAQAALGH